MRSVAKWTMGLALMLAVLAPRAWAQGAPNSSAGAISVWIAPTVEVMTPITPWENVTALLRAVVTLIHVEVAR